MVILNAEIFLVLKITKKYYAYIRIKLLSSLILLGSIIYWSLTILYCSPDNFIKIKFQPILKIFNEVFFQKWSFFAPPPNNNTKLYFRYIDQNNNIIASLEVTDPITKAKKDNAPFNFNEQFLDYSINGSSSMITNFIVQQNRALNFIHKNNTNKDEKNETIHKEIKRYVTNLYAFKNLLNYSKIVKSKTDLISNAKGVIITLTQQDIPKFIDRYKKQDTTQKLIFDSGIIYY